MMLFKRHRGLFIVYTSKVIVIDLLYLDYHNSEDIAQIFSSNLTRARFERAS